MAAILFKAQLVDSFDQPSAELARILFGSDSVADKEKLFRALCQTKFPTLRIVEPLYIAPAPV